MSAFERIADYLIPDFRSAIPECLLSPIAVIHMTENWPDRPPAFGQKQPLTLALVARELQRICANVLDFQLTEVFLDIEELVVHCTQIGVFV